MKLLSKFEMVSCLTLATVSRPMAGTVNEITSIVCIVVLFFKRCDTFRFAFFSDKTFRFCFFLGRKRNYG